MPKRKSLIYRNGTCFAVPLRSGGFATGVVARSNQKGIVFGYFFGPRLLDVRNAKLSELHPARAVYVGKFGDLGILNGEWPILGTILGWSAGDWPMPPLIRMDKAVNRAWVCEYDDRTFACISENEVDPERVAEFVADGTMGYGAMEIRLTKLLTRELSSSG